MRASRDVLLPRSPALRLPARPFLLSALPSAHGSARVVPGPEEHLVRGAEERAASAAQGSPRTIHSPYLALSVETNSSPKDLFSDVSVHTERKPVGDRRDLQCRRQLR
jgi:hypothetical protein